MAFSLAGIDRNRLVGQSCCLDKRATFVEFRIG